VVGKVPVVLVVIFVFVVFRGRDEGQEKHKGEEIHGFSEKVISFFKVTRYIFPLVRDKLSHLVSPRKILPTPANTFSSSFADVVLFGFATNVPSTAAVTGISARQILNFPTARHPTSS